MGVRDEILGSVCELFAKEHASVRFSSTPGYANFFWDSLPGVFEHAIRLESVLLQRDDRLVNCASESELKPEFFVGLCAVDAVIKIDDMSLRAAMSIPEPQYEQIFDRDIAALLAKAAAHNHDDCLAVIARRQQSPEASSAPEHLSAKRYKRILKSAARFLLGSQIVGR